MDRPPPVVTGSDSLAKSQVEFPFCTSELLAKIKWFNAPAELPEFVLQVVVLGGWNCEEICNKSSHRFRGKCKSFDNSLSKLKKITLIDSRVPTSIIDPKN